MNKMEQMDYIYLISIANLREQKKQKYVSERNVYDFVSFSALTF